MAATGSEIRRLAADVAARSQAQGKTARGPAAMLWARLAALTIPMLICAVLALTATMAVSVVKSGGFLGLNGWTALGIVSLVGAILINTVWLRSPRLNGVNVSRKSAPELHALVEEAADELQSPMPGSIVVTDTLHIRLHHTPSLGLLGGTNSVLEIGLPAAQTYSRSELAAFIAMELARFSTQRPAQDRQIERMADLWTGVMQPAARPSYPIDFIAGTIAAWLQPRIAGVARPIRFAWVSTADRAAAELVGRAETAQALLRRAMATAFLDEYWHRLAEEPIVTPKPSFLPYREMADFMPRLGEWEQAEAALRLALVNRPAEAGSEPTLAQRLKAIGVKPAVPAPIVDSATVLLGAAYEQAIQHFDQAWQRANAKAWSRAYVAQATADRLAGAETSPRNEPSRAEPDHSEPIASAAALAETTDSATAFEPQSTAYYAEDASAAEPQPEPALANAEPEPEATQAVALPVNSAPAPTVESAIELAQGAELSEGFERARDRYVDACEWYPDNGRVWLSYAYALMRHQAEEAVECIEHTLGLSPVTRWEMEDAETWFEIGQALLEAGDEGGIVCLEQAIAIDPALTDEAMHLADQFSDPDPFDAAEPQPVSTTPNTQHMAGAS